MTKEKSYREAAQYYHQPFALLRESRVKALKAKDATKTVQDNTDNKKST